jgi:hypothetical protein
LIPALPFKIPGTMKLLRHLWALSLLCGVAWSVHAAGPDIVAAEYYKM